MYLTMFPCLLPNLCSDQSHPDSQQLKNEHEEIIKERLAKVWLFFLITESSSVRIAFINNNVYLF